MSVCCVNVLRTSVSIGDLSDQVDKVTHWVTVTWRPLKAHMGTHEHGSSWQGHAGAWQVDFSILSVI